jgi:hypothetical protein
VFCPQGFRNPLAPRGFDAVISEIQFMPIKTGNIWNLFEKPSFSEISVSALFASGSGV